VFGYKPTHLHHGMTRWVAHSVANYRWAVQHGIALCAEYTRRYQKTHATMVHLCWLMANEPTLEDFKQHVALTAPPQCMPEQYRHSCLDGSQQIVPTTTFGHVVQAYRRYYNHEKARFARWKTGPVPQWFQPCDPLPLLQPKRRLNIDDGVGLQKPTRTRGKAAAMAQRGRKRKRVDDEPVIESRIHSHVSV